MPVRIAELHTLQGASDLGVPNQSSPDVRPCNDPSRETDRGWDGAAAATDISADRATDSQAIDSLSVPSDTRDLRIETVAASERISPVLGPPECPQVSPPGAASEHCARTTNGSRQRMKWHRRPLCHF